MWEAAPVLKPSHIRTFARCSPGRLRKGLGSLYIPEKLAIRLEKLYEV